MPVTPFGILTADDLSAPAASISGSATVPTATTTTLTFGFEAWDPDALASGSTLTIPEAGLWLLSATAEFASNATGWRRLEFLNGASLIGPTSPAVSGEPTRLSFTRGRVCAAATTVEVRARHTAGVNLLVTLTDFTATLIARS